jgi:hypothetical protein
MALDARRIDSDRRHVQLPELFDLIAHGGELSVSTRGVVAWIEDEHDGPAL